MENHYETAKQLDIQAVHWWHNGTDPDGPVTGADKEYAKFLLDRAKLHAILAAVTDDYDAEGA